MRHSEVVDMDDLGLKDRWREEGKRGDAAERRVFKAALTPAVRSMTTDHGVPRVKFAPLHVRGSTVGRQEHPDVIV